jgi:hypothetical protein
LTDQATRKAFLTTIIISWLAFLMSFGGCTVDLLRKPPQRVEVQREIGEYTSASFFARNFITLYLTGKKEDSQALGRMTVITEPPKLPDHPYTILDVNLVEPKRITAGSNTEWTFVAGVTLIPPGTGGAQRNYFFINLLESRDKTFRAMSWPRLVNYTTPAFEMKTLYTQGVALHGPLGLMLNNFVTAFYQSGNPGQLGSFITQNFSEKPITRSPFTSIEVQTIAASQDSPNPSDASPGSTAHILVTVKGSSASDTWSVFQAALEVTLGDNNQWLVNGFDDAIDFGEVSEK